ncbi:electron transport complex subunit RsxC [Shewanella sp. WPAGA9]|uniref:electron transport complex subunit RsxC n=1 Tax=Shewanella sp. ENK2 TaxID=2775245 RepID=UPI001786EA6E|nr:electron transport complex subunit RsxC [Shewanella sp. WPAGA9]
MLTLLEQIDKGTLWHSPGGIHPPQLKSISNQVSSARLPLSRYYSVPVPQVGDSARLQVKVGDAVLKGQMLTEGEGFMYLPVHAPTSGIIADIALKPSNHASGLPVLTCVIQADGKDDSIDYQSSELATLSNQQILDKIMQAGIAGMGGASFPSHIKLNPASEIDLVIINGVECEPYITSDDVIMRENATEILSGINIINTLLSPQRIIIAIEDNKPEAVSAMRSALDNATELQGIVKVTVIPTKYPSGGEKQLIQIITGREVPTGSIPAQQGIVVHNVGTAYAIQDAVLHGKPLIERLVTLTGEQVSTPGNYWLPIGSSVKDILEQVGFDEAPLQKVIIGGPMMGYALPDFDVPVLKGTNCILTPSQNEIAPDAEEKACIRCGECAIACPALLLPQQLFWHAKAEEYDKAASFNLKDCIECGCCSYVCPSDIPLVEYYRIAKSALKNEAEEKRQAEQAKVRFEARLQRLEDEKRAREEKSRLAAEKRKAAMENSDKKNAVAEAMARVAAKKKMAEQNTQADSKPAASTDKSSAVSAAIARAKAKKLAQQAENQASAQEPSAQLDQTTEQASPVDDKKAQIAAAVARAKAKKRAQQSNNKLSEQALDDTKHSVPVDDKKAQIVAAVARAKAKKLAQQSDNKVSEQAPDNTKESVPVDDKKAQIAAAVARAKAKKLAKQAETQSEDQQQTIESSSVNEQSSVQASLSPADEKKARIAAAVAKAKAKRLAQSAGQPQQDDEHLAQTQAIDTPVTVKPETQSDSVTETVTLSPADEKKARIAATVAKAKAKKLAQGATQPLQSEAKAVETDISDTQSDQTSIEPITSAAEVKKARIAAAVAKAKAKKLANQQSSEKE